MLNLPTPRFTLEVAVPHQAPGHDLDYTWEPMLRRGRGVKRSFATAAEAEIVAQQIRRHQPHVQVRVVPV